MTIRGKDVMTRRAIREELLRLNELVDGPWEPAVFVPRYLLERVRERRPGGLYDFAMLRDSARVEHDAEGRLDLHLPGDDEPFDVDAAVAKLRIAEVVAE